MKCEHVKLPGGGTAIVCSSGGRGYRERAHRCACGAIAGLQCDWKIPPPRGRPPLTKGVVRSAGGFQTCDEWICGACAQEVGPNKHLCPEHQRTYKEWLARHTQHSALSTQHSTPEAGA